MAGAWRTGDGTVGNPHELLPEAWKWVSSVAGKLQEKKAKSIKTAPSAWSPANAIAVSDMVNVVI